MRAPNVTELGDGYLYRWQEPDFVEIEMTDVRRSSDTWKAEVTIFTNVPGGRRNQLAEAMHSLNIAHARSALVKSLDETYGLKNGSRWVDYIEVASTLTKRAERVGRPFSPVGKLNGQPPELFLLTHTNGGGYLRLHHPTSLYADGGTGKSTLAVLWGVAIATGRELAGFIPQYSGPVIWLDWESDEWDIDDTIKSVCRGHGVEEEVEFSYRREVWPITQTYRQVVSEVVKRKAALVVIDSVGLACAGDTEKSESVFGFIRAVRALNTSVLLIDHVVKGESGGKAFGSVYKFNEVRLGFELACEQTEGGDESVIAVRCRKSNKGSKPAPLFLQATFGAGVTRYETTSDVSDDLANATFQVKDRIRRVLRVATGLMNVDEITERTAAEKGQVRARLSELVKSGEVFVSEQKGMARRYCLKSEREA